MKPKIREFLRKYLGLTIIVSAIVGAIFSWAVTWILPSRDVTASNIPQKELTCTLDYFCPMIIRRSSDNRLQLLYDGEPVSSPYVYGITVTNTGAYAVKLLLRNAPKEQHDDRIKTGIILFSIPILFTAGTLIWTSVSWRKWRKEERELIQKYIGEQQNEE